MSIDHMEMLGMIVVCITGSVCIITILANPIAYNPAPDAVGMGLLVAGLISLVASVGQLISEVSDNRGDTP